MPKPGSKPKKKTVVRPEGVFTIATSGGETVIECAGAGGGRATVRVSDAKAKIRCVSAREDVREIAFATHERSAEAYVFWRAGDGETPREVYRCSSGDVDLFDAALSPDGRKLAVALGIVSSPGELRVVDVASGAERTLDAELEQPAGLYWANARTLLYFNVEDADNQERWSTRERPRHVGLAACEACAIDVDANAPAMPDEVAYEGSARAVFGGFARPKPPPAPPPRRAQAHADWPAWYGTADGAYASPSPMRPPLAEAWSFAITRKSYDGAAVGGRERIVVPVRGTNVACLDLATGTLLWERCNARTDESPVFLVGGWVFVQRENHWTALALADGREQEVKDPGGRPIHSIYTPSVLVDGRICLRPSGVRLDAENLRPETGAFVGHLLRPPHTIRTVGEYPAYEYVWADLANGAELGRWTTAEMERLGHFSALTPTAAILAQSTGHAPCFRGLDLKARACLWETRAYFETVGAYGHFTLWNDALFCRVWENQTQFVKACGLESGEERWKRPLAVARYSGGLLATKDFVWLLEQDERNRRLLALNPLDGATAWQSDPLPDDARLSGVAGETLLLQYGRRLHAWRPTDA